MRKSARAYKELDNWIFGRSIRGDLNMLRTAVVPEVIAGVVSKSKSDGAIFRCSARPFLAYPIGRWFTH
jgi:hypothetical protein